MFKRCRSQSAKAKYLSAVKAYKTAVDNFHVNRETKLIESGHLGDFYKHVNSKLVSRSGIPTLLDTNGLAVTDCAQKAELFNNYFKSVFTVDDGVCPSLPSDSAPTGLIRDILFNYDSVVKSVLKLKPKLTLDPDGLNSYFLKHVAGSVALPLMHIFNSSFHTGNLPKSWKHAVITPVFKKGLASDVGNYRPISITSICCKIMETLIHDQMINFLFKHDIISSQQHGFLSKRSTLSQMIEVVNDWTLAINCKSMVDIVYIDFAKAFDSVVHSKLCLKLKHVGIDGKLLAWISSFLENRSQSIKVGGYYSSVSSVLSGVSQGSVLGPLLFLLFINDITKLFGPGVHIKLFADDVKIYAVINDDDRLDHNIIQTALDQLSTWAQIWQLKISVPKCSVIHLGFANPKHTYHIDDLYLPSLHTCKDLGIFVDADLHFKSQIYNIASKAHQRAALIKRSFRSRDPQLLFRAFIVYVRPILEYNSSVWSPSYARYIDVLEKVQRRFTKGLSGFKHLSYADRLHKLGAETLELRRLRADLILVYKIVHQLITVDFNSLFNFSSHSWNTRGHNFRLLKPHTSCNARAHSFACRVVDVWNSLPDCIVNATSLYIFKRLICSQQSTLILNNFLRQL